MRINEIMTTPVVSVEMDDTLRAVRELFDQHGFHHLVVVDRGRLVGLVSDRDLLRHLSPFIGGPSERSIDAASLNKRVHQIMSRRIVAVREDAPVEKAVMLMLDRRISCLPVVDDQGICRGIVTWRNMMEWCLSGKCGLTPAASPEPALHT
jgi:acetoin utilization protein AcuB